MLIRGITPQAVPRGRRPRRGCASSSPGGEKRQARRELGRPGRIPHRQWDHAGRDRRLVALRREAPLLNMAEAVEHVASERAKR